MHKHTSVSCKRKSRVLSGQEVVLTSLYAVYNNSRTKTLIFGTNYKGKDKFSSGLFIETLPNETVQEEIICSDGPTSEFKNRYMRNLIQKLSAIYNKPFVWRFSETAHGKGVVDGVGGRVKSLVHKDVMPLGKNQNNVQDAESFWKLAKQLNQQTVVHVLTEVVKYKDTNPFAELVPVNGIFKMHVMRRDGVNSHLWLNSSYYNDAEPASILLPKQVASGIVATGTAPAKPQPCTEKPFSYHDVRITKGNFTGYYAVITETGDLSDKDVKDKVEINYLKKSFSKWVVAEKDLDSRKIVEIIHVKAIIDGRSRYTIFEWHYLN